MSARQSSGRRSNLAERRRRARRRVSIALTAGLVALCVIALYGVQQQGVRVSRIQIYGTELPLEPVVRESLTGSYLGIIPRDSIFFYPERAIRARITERYGNVAGVSFYPNGTTGLTLRITERVPIARWCPTRPSTTSASSSPADSLDDCWFFDDSGVLFATTSQIAVVYPFLIHEPIALEATRRGLRLPHADQIPAALGFARQLDTFGVGATSIRLQNGEATIGLEQGAHITYLLGSETMAYTALVSAKNHLVLSAPDLEYVDLRFDGKMYLKRKSATVAE